MQRTQYTLNAYSVSEKIRLKQSSELLHAYPNERYNQDCLIIHLEALEKIFIFRFGTVVFLNVSMETQERYLSILGLTPKTKTLNHDDLEDLAKDHFSIMIEPGSPDVRFNSVKLEAFDLPKIQLIAHILAQSSALELIEWEVEDFLTESDSMTHQMKKGVLAHRSRSRLMQFIGEGLSARHRIVNQLSLLNEPEKTWDKEDLYKLYQDLFKTFDMTHRLDRLEKMLSLSSDVSELLLEMMNGRHAEILEWIVIILISMEVIINCVHIYKLL